MSQRPGGVRAEIYEGYANARRKAVEAMNHGVTRSFETCVNDKNLVLVLFLRCEPLSRFA